ncbi:MAG: YHS domain-containing protein [Anaerolineales bacterium]|nr:YHS domain-containing protein [Anaerolineales bacterium]
MDSFNMQRYYPAGQEYEIDPVCEMKVDPKNPPFQVIHKGMTYYFCSEVCKHLFERVPDQYIRMEEDSE